MKSIILVIVFIFTTIPCFNQTKCSKIPFTIKLIEKPARLKVGRTYKFVLEVRNTSRNSLTLSSFCATGASLSWVNKDGTGGGTGSGCGGSTIVVSHSIDPATGKITGKSEIYPYSEDDFFTLSPNGSKRFEVELFVPKNIKRKFVNVHIKFESEYDGSAVGIKAWTGEAKYITLRMSVLNE